MGQIEGRKGAPGILQRRRQGLLRHAKGSVVARLCIKYESDPSSVVVFLEKLETYKALPASHVAKLDELYGLNKTENVEIRLRFYLIALKSGPEYSKSAAGE